MAIVLFTDFGHADPYVGQVKAVLCEDAPGQPVIDLLHDAPAFDIVASAHLLAACVERFKTGTVILAVVDPGVGTDRDAVVVQVGGRYLVGPDNGLLSVHAARAGAAKCWSITWRPQESSASFHGRDIFAPVAAAIARGDWPQDKLVPKTRLDVEFGAGDLRRVIYIDHFGNVWTALRARGMRHDACFTVAGERVAYRRVFAEGAPGVPFWYENSLGLAEIAVNCGNAAKDLGLHIGEAVLLVGEGISEQSSHT